MSASTQQVKVLNNVDDDNYAYNGDLYKYLALNDTIHDFGKGHDRGDDINDIVKSILNEVPYKKYTPFGNTGLFSLSPFEANTEAFLLENFNLVGIPENILSVEPFIKKSSLGDVNPKTTADIYKFENKNGYINYGLKMSSTDIMNLTDIQKQNIFYNTVNIHPSMDTLSTIIITDSGRQFKKSIDDIKKDSPDAKKNYIGQFLMKFFFFGDGTNQTLVHNTDAGSGDLGCLFNQGFQDNVLGTVRDACNYGDSATTSVNEKPCFKDAPPNPFVKDIGNGAVISVEEDKMILKKKDNKGNLIKLPSVFPRTVLDSDRDIYIFKNNLFTIDTFVLAYTSNPSNPWVPSKSPYNFALNLYIIPENISRGNFVETILNNPSSTIPVAEANFYPTSTDSKISINGPSVVYLKSLIKRINAPSTTKDNIIDAFKLAPSTNCLNLTNFLTNVYNKLTGSFEYKKNRLTKLLFDLKRCGDYEQVDAIELIQQQNMGTKNIAGLQDVLFTSVDRLCTLYSRYRVNNCMMAITTNHSYKLYRQPYIYPSADVLKTININKALFQVQNKNNLVIEFLTKLKGLYVDVDYVSLYNSSELSELLIVSSDETNAYNRVITTIIKNIFVFQNKCLINLKYITENNYNKLIAEPSGLIQFFNEIKNKITDYSNENAPKQIIVDDNFDIFEGINKNNMFVKGINYSKIVNQYYDVLNQNLYGTFDLQIIKESIYDVDTEQKFSVNLPVINLKPKTVLEFISDLSLDKKNFYLEYYTNLKKIRNNLLIKSTTNGRQSRTGAKTANAGDLLEFYLNVKGLIKMMESIFNIQNNPFLNILDESINQYIDVIIESKRYGTPQAVNQPTGDSPSSPETMSSTMEDMLIKVDSTQNLDLLESSIPDVDNKSGIEQVMTNENTTITNKQDLKNKREEERQRRQQVKDQKAIDKRKQNLDKIKPLLEIDRVLRSSKSSAINKIKSQLYPDKNSQLTATATMPLDKRSKRVQRGGGEDDKTMGGILVDLIYEIPDVMNQIYTNLMPSELLEILLLDFNINYMGFESPEEIRPVVIDGDNNQSINQQSDNQFDTQNDAVDSMNVDVQESIGEESVPLVLSRQEYLTDFFTELIQMLEMNENKLESVIFGDINTPEMEQLKKIKAFLLGNNMVGVEGLLFEDNNTNTSNFVSIYDTIFNKNNAILTQNLDLNNFIPAICCNPLYKTSVMNQIDDLNNKFFDMILNYKKSEPGNEMADEIDVERTTEPDDTYLSIKNYLENPGEGIKNTKDLGAKNATEESIDILSMILLNYNADNDTNKITFTNDNGALNVYLTHLNNIYSNVDSIKNKSIKKLLSNMVTNNNTKVVIFYILCLISNLVTDKEGVYFPTNPTINNDVITSFGGGERGATTYINYESLFKGLTNVIVNVMELVNIPTCSVNITPSPSPSHSPSIISSNGGQSKKMVKQTRKNLKPSLNRNKTRRMK